MGIAPPSEADPNDTGTVARNSLWNLLQSVVTAVVGMAVSVLAARHLGNADFGVLSYVIWLTTVVATLADIGMDQALRRHVPAWFATPETRPWALWLARRAVAIQLGVATFAGLALTVLYPWWSRSLTLAHSSLERVVVIGLVTVLPMVVVRCLATFLRSIQATRDLALVSLIGQGIYLLLVVGAVLSGLPLVALVGAALIAQVVLAAGLVTAMRRRARGVPDTAGARPASSLTRYALIAYANVLLQQVVWGRSEMFFLGLYSPAPEAGFYGLAFTIAGVVGGLVGVCQQALFAAQFGLLAGDREARSDRIASFSVKYLGLVFLPGSLVIWLFLDSAVQLLYGSAYQTVARVFPLVLFATVVAGLLNPVWTKVHLSNRKLAGALGIGLVGAALNVVLDLVLIPTHHAVGAAVANCVSQVLVVVMGMSFVAIVSPVRLELRALGAIALVNLVLAGVFWLVLERANVLTVKLGVTLVAAIVYVRWLAAWGAFGEADRTLMASLEQRGPEWLRPLARWFRGSMGREATA